MPVRLWKRRITVAGLVGRERRRATLTAGLTVPAVMAAVLAVPGCRTDSTSARLSPLNPTHWLQRQGESDAANLQPVPPEQVTAPPLPLSPAGTDPFAPEKRPVPPSAPAAPRPEPIDAEEGEAFYNVQPTGAELEVPREPSWTNRFRTLFRRQASAETEKSGVRSASATGRDDGERPPSPPTQRVARRSTVRLGGPEFDPDEERADEPVRTQEPIGVLEPNTESTSVRTVAQSEPARLPKIRGSEPLPVIVPGRTAAPAQAEIGPQAWPYAVSEQPRFTPAPVPTAFDPEPSPPPLLRTFDDSAGPTLLR